MTLYPPPVRAYPRAANISRAIHQTYGSKTIPADISNNILRIKSLNPGFQHHLYDDHDIQNLVFADYGKDVLDVLNRISPNYGAARADLFRYLLIYKNGGVYLDIKSTVVESLDRFILDSDQFILAQWKETGKNEMFDAWGTNDECSHVPGGEFQQWHIIAAAGHPFLKAVIEKVLLNILTYRPWVHDIGRVGTLRTTGPRAYTNAIYPLLPLHEHRLVASEKQIGLRYSIFNDTVSHLRLSHRYYRHNRSPVVRLKGVLIIAGWLYSAFRTITDSYKVNRIFSSFRGFRLDGKGRQINSGGGLQ